MTLPKTHPLYGAVEVLARTYGADTPLESKRPWIQEHFTRKAMGHIRALESAGYRVVGPEPTREMINAAEEMYMPMGEMIAAWDGFWHAAPTITGTEKGG